MQSILQYRRMRDALEEQLRSRSSHPSSGSTCQPRSPADHDHLTPDETSTSSSTSTSTADVEKQEHIKHAQRDQSVASDSTLATTLAADQRSTQSPEKSGRRGGPLAVPGIEVRDADAREGQDQPLYIVTFDSDDDPLNPKNWSAARKWTAMGVVAWTGFAVGWASSIDSAASKQAMETFGVGQVAESLATGLYLIGFGVGSLVAGPFSETVGRNLVYIGSLVLFMIFVMASGLAPNFGAQLAFRFLAGFFGCTPLTTFGGSMSDLFYPVDRVYVFPVCGCLSFLGPFLAPMVGAWIGQSTHISWRWTEWTTLILTGIITVAIALIVPETYAPILLKWKATHLRQLTGDARYVAEVETEPTTLAQKLVRSTYRPFDMLVHEIMVALFTLYLSVVYIVLFGFLVGFDFIFGETHHFSQGAVGLTFIGMNVGFLLALAMAPAIYLQYKRKLHQATSRGASSIAPEEHLWYAMLGAPWLPISLFWMAWTSDPNISYWSPLVATVCFGFSVQGIFISTYQYLIDSYEAYAASALVTCVLFRYVAAGAMQVVSIPMYRNLGVHWALTLLGCISVVVTPVPYVFYIWGKPIRDRYSRDAKA